MKQRAMDIKIEYRNRNINLFDRIETSHVNHAKKKSMKLTHLLKELQRKSELCVVSKYS